jgi:hypothetical protein
MYRSAGPKLQNALGLPPKQQAKPPESDGNRPMSSINHGLIYSAGGVCDNARHYTAMREGREFRAALKLVSLADISGEIP